MGLGLGLGLGLVLGLGLGLGVRGRVRVRVRERLTTPYLRRSQPSHDHLVRGWCEVQGYRVRLGLGLG